MGSQWAQRAHNGLKKDSATLFASPRKNFKFFSNALNKKLKHPTLKPPTKSKRTMTSKLTVDNDFNYSTDRTPAGNRVDGLTACKR